MAARFRLVATCWDPEPDRLVAIVETAAGKLAAAGVAHLVEARLDLLGRPPTDRVLESLARAAGGSLLATCRPDGAGSPEGSDRVPMLARAVELGAAGCDVELGTDPPALREGALLVASHHFPVLPDRAQLSLIAGGLAAMRPAIAKIAAPVQSLADAMALCEAAARLPADVDLALAPLGAAGIALRLLAPRPGPGWERPLSALAYVRADARLPGPDVGQPSLDDALGRDAIALVADATRVFAVAGWPLEATWSPALHGSLFRRRGIDARFVKAPLRDAREWALVADALRLEGAAFTMPHKSMAAGIADMLGPRARRLGSANTLRLQGGAWEAEDFDGPAAVAALARVIEPLGADVVVLGAGGAARAAALALVEAGARVTLLARRESEAREACRVAGAHEAGPLDPVRIRAADALVHATPAGSQGHPPRVLDEDALPRIAVLDMVTTPPLTPLLRAARAAGLRTVDGLAMLALQAAAQQRWWCEGLGDAPALPDEDVESMLRALVEEERRA